MDSILHLTDEAILLAGDWHGSLTQGMAALRLAQRSSIATVIQLGDFGYWGDSDTAQYLDKMEFYLAANDMHLYFVDGNHENFPALYQVPLSDDGLRHVRPHITHLPRGTVFRWKDYRVLGLGGAYSIDRRYRVLGTSYFLEEAITDSDIADAIRNMNGETVDIMLTHDSPASAPNPITDDPLRQHVVARTFGSDHVQESISHRQILDTVFHNAQPLVLAHGHYHEAFNKRTQYGIVCGLNEGTHGTRGSTMLLNEEVMGFARELASP